MQAGHPVTLKDDLLDAFPVLRAVPSDVLEDVLASAAVRDVPAGTVMFEPGSPCRGFPLVLSGTVRVVKHAPNGREVMLYTVHPGEACLMSAGCMLGDANFQATGVTGSHVRLVALPPGAFNRLVSNSVAFRTYVFALFSERLAGLMELIEAVMFQKLDQRLAGLLLRRTSPIRATHQTLADELGSVREIVSRLLRNFEDHGWVALGRERIDVLDPQALGRLAGG